MSNPTAKCRRCSFPIEARDLIIEFGDGDVIHIRCWLVTETEERVRGTNDHIRRSQQSIDASRRRLREFDADPPPSDPDVRAS